MPHVTPSSLLIGAAALALIGMPARAATPVPSPSHQHLLIQAQTTVIPNSDDEDDDDETGAVDIGPEQDVVIRRRIIEERAPAVTIEIPRGPVTVGSVIPRDIPLRPMRGIGSARLERYAYFISPDEKIVVVEPQTREVVRIIGMDR